MRFLGVLNALLNSRKVVVVSAFLIVGGAILFGYNDVAPELVISYLAAAGYLIGEVVKAIRDEDVAKHTAAGMVNAAVVTASQPSQPTVGIDANTVQVTPAKPTIAPDGLR